ncbi:excitatory amino acid transporter 3-like isoform X2 [Cyclopterus lumpus]|uniref:excitatory amino acid transporter 3-like isoform X2 n=1 Tax=Cyclopterus lumpus TaxID=8103 RepID=UPI0014869266|nr:excitatory amino acid transporter 3-like isoform X2 [Cyclopterus lumpus]
MPLQTMENTVTEEENAAPPLRRGRWSGVKRRWDYLLQNAFVASSLAAVVLGIALGLFLKFYINLSDHDQLYIIFPGEVLQRILQVVSIPLIITSVITSCSGLKGGKVAVRASAYFVSTTLLSMTLGLILVLTIKPGLDAVGKDDTEDEELFSIVIAILDIAWNISPENLMVACYRQDKTERVEFEIEADEQRFSLETNATRVRIEHHGVEGTNILGLIVWSLVFGLALNKMGKRGEIFLEALTVFNEVTKNAVKGILSYLPLGVLFMVTGIVVEVDDWEITFKLGKFIGVVVFGLVIHGTLVLPLIYFLFVRRNPYAVIKGFFPALKTAFVVSSSSATLPLTFQCCEERLKVDKRISRFMLPIATNINMDGTFIYEVVAAVFIAQLNHIDLQLNQWITIADRCNTVINVLGDCIGVALIDQVSKGDLEDIGEQGQEIKRGHDSDAEAQTPDKIQVHIS